MVKILVTLLGSCFADESQSLLQATLGIKGELQKQMAMVTDHKVESVETDSTGGLSTSPLKANMSKFDMDFPTCFRGFCRDPKCLPVWNFEGLQVSNCKKNGTTAWCATQWNADEGDAVACTRDEDYDPGATEDKFGGSTQDRVCHTHLDCATDSCGAILVSEDGESPGNLASRVTCQEGRCMRTEDNEECDIKVVREKPHECINGWRALPICKKKWTHKGTWLRSERDHNECSTWSSFGEATPWCSFESVFDDDDQWARCEPCREELHTTSINKLQQWESVIHSMREFGQSALEIGTSDGNHVLKFESGGQKLDRQMRGASIGKFLGGVGIASAVNTGSINWETRACDVWEWWTCDESDNRSTVTFYDASVFMSGFRPTMVEDNGTIGQANNAMASFDHHPVSESCLNMDIQALANVDFDTWTIEDCVRQIYNNSRHECRSGECIAYNSLHQTIALGMVCAVLGLSPDEFWEQYLFAPAGMTSTSFHPRGRNVAGGIYGTGSDYVKFARTFLNGGYGQGEWLDKVNFDAYQNVKWINPEEAIFGPGRSESFAVGHAPAGQVQLWGGAFGAELVVDFEFNTYFVHVPSYTGLTTGSPAVFWDNSIWGEMNKALGTDHRGKLEFLR